MTKDSPVSHNFDDATESNQSDAELTGPSVQAAGILHALSQPSSSSRHKRQAEADHSDSNAKRQKKANDKGLRYFSIKVCEKLSKTRVTTHSQIANQLISELDTPLTQLDEKNIRRRIYDALNVLTALNIIQKNKKSIQWVGFNDSCHLDSSHLLEERKRKEQQVRQKQKQLEDSILQYIARKNILTRHSSRGCGVLHSPFIVISAPNDTTISCEMNEERSHVVFDFSEPFNIHDYNLIMKEVGLKQCSFVDLKSFVPPTLQSLLPSLFPEHHFQHLDSAQMQQLHQSTLRSASFSM